MTHGITYGARGGMIEDDTDDEPTPEEIARQYVEEHGLVEDEEE